MPMWLVRCYAEGLQREFAHDDSDADEAPITAETHDDLGALGITPMQIQ